MRRVVRLSEMSEPITSKRIRSPQVRFVQEMEIHFDLLDIGGRDGLIVMLRDRGFKSYSTLAEFLENLLEMHDRLRQENEVILLDPPPSSFANGVFVIDPKVSEFDLSKHVTGLFSQETHFMQVLHTLTLRYASPLSVQIPQENPVLPAPHR
uniref:Uncharacterized protein n=1 Tax=Trichuris muris TaxID=70415 RepID=A0A5S6R607_TRIMR